MSNIIFPAGSIIDFPDLSMEMMQHYSKKWNLVHTQIEKGLFNAKLTAVHTPRIQLAISHYTQGVMTKGDFPKGCIVLNSYFSSNGTYTVKNRSILPNEIVVLSKDDKVDRVTTGHFSGNIITIEEKLFYEVFCIFFGETPDMFLRKKRFNIKDDMIHTFHKTISFWIDYLINIFPSLDIKPEYEKIEYEILSQLFNCITFTSLKDNRKKFQIHTVRDFLHENISNDINLAMLSRSLDISESQLHKAFKSNYGISPKKYLQMLRLNAVRKELLLADPKDVNVSEIAIKYNFFSMNHFSVEYKKIFAQTPSETLGK